MKEKTVATICGICGVITVIAVVVMLVFLNQDSNKDKNKKEESKETTGQAEISQVADGWTLEEISKYITVGKYKGVTGTKEVYTLEDITEEEVEDEIASVLDSYAEYQEVNRGAKKEDLCNINFVGTMNGNIAEDTSYTDEDGYDFVLGSGEFFAEFEETIVGMKPGETKKADMIFPEEFDDYAGQKVTFEITMNRIQECIYYPKLNDAFVKEEWNYDNVEDYKKSVRESLFAQIQSDANAMMKEEMWETVLADATLGEYTDAMYQAAENSLQESLDKEAEEYGFEKEEYRQFSFETEEEWKEGVEEQLKSELVAQYILKSEKKDDAKTGNEGILQAQGIVEQYGIYTEE